MAWTESNFESMTSNETIIRLSDCKKCSDFEQQLHQALNGLNSAWLIIDLFNKEHNPDSMDTTVSHQVRTDLEGYDKWKLVTPRRLKVKIGD